MRERPKNELEELSAGLSKIEDPLDYIPLHIEKTLDPLTQEELEALLIKGCNIASAIMAQKGWILMALKKKVGHGNFKNYLLSINFNYVYANQCMNVARAVSHHPALAHFPDTNLLRKIVYLPEAKQAAIEVEFKTVTHEVKDGKVIKGSKKWHDLRPWILEQVAAELRENWGKGKKKKKEHKEVEVTKPTDLDKLYAQALSALRQIADLVIGEEEHGKLEEYLVHLRPAWERAHYNLSDPAHAGVPPWELGNMDDISEEGLEIIKKGGRGHGQGRHLHA